MSIDRATELLALRTTARLPRGSWARLEAARADDADARVRSAALTVIAERGDRARATQALLASVTDDAPAIRRRVGELAIVRPAGALAPALCALLRDPDTTVVETAAAALGECPLTRETRSSVLDVLIDAATNNEEPLVREAAVAALGSIGDPRGLPAILAGCSDKPAIRRRAVLALAPFDGPEVDAAVERALGDRDWQTRQAAELLREG